MLRRLGLVSAAVLAVALPLAAPGAARAGSGDNAAIAINTKDGSSLFKFAFSIRRAASDVVDQTNGAVAYASCTDCQTVAIAIEVVLVTGDPSVVTPTNVAISINDQCDTCVTVADAYQFVLGTGGNVHFDAHSMQQIEEIVKEIRDLGKENLSADEIQARLEPLVQQLAQVIADGLVASGNSGSGGTGSSGSGGDETTSTTPAQPPPPGTTTETTTEPTTEPSTSTETTTETVTTDTTTGSETTTAP